jgi:thiol-disulfide isomerase/thioredoxin
VGNIDGDGYGSQKDMEVIVAAGIQKYIKNIIKRYQFKNKVMNKLFLLSTLVLSILSCSKHGNNEFLVKGKVLNSEGKTIFLSEYVEKKLVNIDSVELSENGEFKLVGKTSYPKFYMLRISPSDFITLILDSASIVNVTADAENFVSSHKVEGSEDMKLVEQFVGRMNKTLAIKDSLSKVYEASLGTDSHDSVKTEIDKKFNLVVDEHRAYAKKMVELNPSSMACLLALSQQIIPGMVNVFVYPADQAYFEKVDAELFKRYPQSEDVRALHNFLIRMKSSKAEAVSSKTYGIGEVVPNIELNNPDGKILSLYSLRGKYVLLDFWAGWCKPCRQENPKLLESYKKYKSRGFEIFQVSLDKEKSRWVEAINDDKISEWYHVSDLQFWQSVPARAYNITGIPANFLLNPKGEVIATNLRGDQLSAKLMEIYKF